MDADKAQRILLKKAELVDRFPFCPDHRDKVAGKDCRECEIERLTALVKSAYIEGCCASDGSDKNWGGFSDSPDDLWDDSVAKNILDKL